MTTHDFNMEAERSERDTRIYFGLESWLGHINKAAPCDRSGYQALKGQKTTNKVQNIDRF